MSADSDLSSPIARAAELLAQLPVQLDAVLAHLCTDLAADGASVMVGAGLDRQCVGRTGATDGPSSLHPVAQATECNLLLHGGSAQPARLAPWLGLLSAALARRGQAGGEPQRRLYTAGGMMRMMAHDLRNLLGVFDQNVTFVEQGLDDLRLPKEHATREDIIQVRDASVRVLAYVQLVHELAHILQGPWPPQSANLLFARALESSEGPLDGGGQGVVVIEPGLPEIAVDQPRVQMIVDELSRNAVQAGASRVQFQVGRSPHAGPTVQAWTQSLPAGPYVYFTIADDGHGMDVFVLTRYGETRYCHPPRSNRSGMGVSMIRTILEAIGGRIAVTSHSGEGATVTVAIPAADHPAPGTGGTVSALVPASERLQVAVRLTDASLSDWVHKTLEDAQFDVVSEVREAAVLVADRTGADQYPGPPTSLFFIGQGWPAGMARPDAVMPPRPDRDGFIRRLSMAVARRKRRK